MTTKFTDATGKVVYSDAPHQIETGNYEETPDLRPWLVVWFGEAVPGIESDDLGLGNRMELLQPPLRVEVM